jgi:ADP-heptose:LPS heptosyltransferase
MSCLVIKNDGIGDLIVSSGIIAGLSKYFKGQLDLVTCEANREVVQMIPGVRRTLYVSRDNLAFSQRLGRFGILHGTGSHRDNRVLTDLRRARYDVAISLRRFIRQSTLVLMRAARAERRLCAWEFPTNTTDRQAHAASRGWIQYSEKNKDLWEADYYRRFLKQTLGIEIDSKPILSLGRSDGSTMGQLKTLAIGISGNGPRWPDAYWCELISKLAHRGWRVNVYGGNDSEMLGKQLSQLGTCIEWRGQKPLDVTARELQQHSYYIGNDTGLTHLASVFCRRVVVVCGGGTFRRFFPWSTASNQHVIYHSLPCFDCHWKCIYPDKYCLSLVKPKDVLSFLEDVNGCCAPRELDVNQGNLADYGAGELASMLQRTQ